SVFNADAVTITPGIGDSASSGSAAVNISGPVTYQITATGICGQETANLRIAFGPPVLTGISPSSGIPGSKVKFTFDNLTEPATVTGGVVTYPDGNSSVVYLDTDDDGNQSFAIPLAHGIGNAASGDYAGAVTIAAQLSNGTTTAALPFTVEPIVYAGDAVADF